MSYAFLGALGVSAVKKTYATAADAANCGAWLTIFPIPWATASSRA